MPFDYFYVNHPFHTGQIVEITEEEFHHLSHVMRTKIGKSITLINGRGELAHATLLTHQKKQAKAEITNVKKKPSPSNKIILIQALPKLSSLEGIFRKTTELGVDLFYLFPSERSKKKKVNSNKLHHFQQILIAAIKQSGRLFLPQIKIFPNLQAIPPTNGTTFFGDLQSSAPSFQKRWQELPEKKSPFSFFIGPESGFTHEEIKELKKRFHAESIKLNPYILQSETASICAIALLTHFSLIKHK